MNENEIVSVAWRMHRHSCIVCGNILNLDPSVSFHRFLSNLDRGERWLSVFRMEQTQLRSQS